MKKAEKERLMKIKVEMRELSLGAQDVEMAHGRADDLLAEAVALLGHKDLALYYEDIDKQFG